MAGYAALALVIELVVRGHPIGRLLPALHVAGIGCVTLALAVLVVRQAAKEGQALARLTEASRLAKGSATN